MGTLMFECPATGTEVSSGIEVDKVSFESLSPWTTYLSCPHCPSPHPMQAVRTWLSTGTEHIPASPAVGGVVQTMAQE
jgi:hypothetical protein